MWPSEMNVISSDNLFCYCCLATDLKLYEIHIHKLAEPYMQLIGTPLLPFDRHLQYICSCCRMLLVKFSRFRARCTKAQELYKNALVQRHCITKAYIKNLTSQWPELKLNYEKTPTKVQEYVDTEDELEEISLEQENIDVDTELEECEVKTEVETEIYVDNDINNLEMKDPLKIIAEDHIKQCEAKKECKAQTKKRKKRVGYKKNSEKFTIEYANSINFDVTILTKKQQIEEIEEKKKEISAIGKKCNHCGKNFKNQDTFDLHNKNYHDPNIGKLVCDICNTYFESRRNYLSHIKMHTTKFCCKTCGFKTKAEESLKDHYDFHNGKSYKCQYCGVSFGKRSSYFTHVRVKHASELNWCELCGESFVGKQGIIAHKKRSHKDIENTDYTCDKCNKNFLNDDALKKHEGFNKCDLFSCTKCGDNFVTEQLLKYHLIQHRNDQNLECENCKVRFLNLAALNKHEDVCEGGGCVCVQCGESFKTDALLNEHVIELHTVEDEFRCEQCNKTFSNVAYFNIHIATHKNWKSGEKLESGKVGVHTKRKKRKPKTISNTLHKWMAVREHEEGRDVVIEKLNTGEGISRNKKYRGNGAVCEVCGKTFSPCNLKAHQLIHKSEFIHQCTECPKRFLRDYALVEHMRVHTGERPYKCETCPKAFKSLSALGRHNLIHSGVRRHVCQHCEKSFLTSSDVKLHIKTVHMKLPMPPRNRRRNRVKDE